MQVNGQHYRTIWIDPATPQVIKVIDQRHLPHQFVIEDLSTVDEVAVAIRDMHIRGAGLIGATAGYGMYLSALHADPARFMETLIADGEKLKATRSTAQAKFTAVGRVALSLSPSAISVPIKRVGSACRADRYMP